MLDIVGQSAGHSWSVSPSGFCPGGSWEKPPSLWSLGPSATDSAIQLEKSSCMDSMFSRDVAEQRFSPKPSVHISFSTDLKAAPRVPRQSEPCKIFKALQECLTSVCLSFRPTLPTLSQAFEALLCQRSALRPRLGAPGEVGTATTTCRMSLAELLRPAAWQGGQGGQGSEVERGGRHKERSHVTPDASKYGRSSVVGRCSFAMLCGDFVRLQQEELLFFGGGG